MPLNTQQTETLYNEVFISYSRENQDFAQDIVQAIYDAGRKGIWIDWEAIPTGADWWETIQAGIDSADNFIFILSPASVRSQVCADEVNYAVEAGKRIITIEYEKVSNPSDKGRIHPAISAHNWLPFTEEDDFDEGVALLIEVVETDLKHVRFHTRLQTRAREWQQANRNLAYLLSAGELAEAQEWLIKAGLDDKRPFVTDLQRQYIDISQKAENFRKAKQAQIARRVQGSEQASMVLGVISVIAGISVLVALFFIQQANTRVAEADMQVTQAAEHVITAEADIAEKRFQADIEIQQARNQASAPLTQAANELEQVKAHAANEAATAAAQLAEAENQAALDIAQNDRWEAVQQSFNCEAGYCVEMLLVPLGCFKMGTDRDIVQIERPAHQQCIGRPFWIDRYEVTNEQFEALGGQATTDSDWLDPSQPRSNITWSEALAFCRLRAGTLPTELEWEYAARGRESLRYPWGNLFVSENAAYSENALEQVAIVGSYPQGASWVGAMDMLGNVWEWTSSISDPLKFKYPYVSDDGREDLSDMTAHRILRGGSFLDDENSLYAAKRGNAEATEQASEIGFRCVIPIESP